ncbi:MAG: DUF2288 domain-containing protein [Cyanobacteria bacterium P01_A01_bin.45]
MTEKDIRAQLTQNLDESEWEWLIPHAKRDMIIVVTQELNLLDVGEAIATDKASFVQVWIDEALITKPSTQQIGEWNSQPSKRFNALIVEPYVLIQEKSTA